MDDLRGLSALVVEDEGPIALLIEDMLADLGCEVVAAAASLEKACSLAESVDVDFALLDLNLNGASALPVADILRRREIPFVFSTGYGAAGIPDEYKLHPMLAKPFLTQDLKQKIASAIRFDKK